MHLLKAMIQRGLSVDDVLEAAKNGEIIADYPSDKPYPSCLIMCSVNQNPIHVVIAVDDVNNNCIVITCYKPNPDLWDTSFKFKI